MPWYFVKRAESSGREGWKGEDGFCEVALWRTLARAAADSMAMFAPMPMSAVLDGDSVSWCVLYGNLRLTPRA